MRIGYETRRPQEAERGVSKEAGRPIRHRGQKQKGDYWEATQRDRGGSNREEDQQNQIVFECRDETYYFIQ